MFIWSFDLGEMVVSKTPKPWPWLCWCCVRVCVGPRGTARKSGSNCVCGLVCALGWLAAEEDTRFPFACSHRQSLPGVCMVVPFNDGSRHPSALLLRKDDAQHA